MEKNPDQGQASQAMDSDDSTTSRETSLGTTENVAGLLTYILGWVTGIVFLLIEKDNKFVRFHAMQSIVIFVPLTIASFVVGFLPFVGGFLTTIVSLAMVVIWLFMMFQAFQGKRFKFPYAGDYAETQLKNMGTK